MAKSWAATHPESGYGRNTWIKGLVEVVTKDKRRKAHPTEQAIGKLIAKIEADPSWFPGKVYGSLGGAPQQIPSLNKATVARSAMAWKKSGGEPTYPSTIARNKKAALNPVTGEPISPDTMSRIFREMCYDEGKDDKWQHLPRLSGKPFTPQEIRKRLAFGESMEGRHTAAWYFKHVVWTDVCCDLQPLSQKKAQLQIMARKGGSGWQSKGSRRKSYNLREDKGHLKIKQKKESKRVYWMPVLARGKLHVELLGSDFPGDKVEGMDKFVEKLAKVLRLRFPDSHQRPDVVFVDRGEGFYKSNGIITGEFGAALRRHKLKAFHGRDAELQPGRSGDLWLHETTVSWVREQMKRTQPAEPWHESEAQLGKRLKAAAGHCTHKFDLGSLCKAFPDEMHDLVHVPKGDRLNK